MSKSKYKIEVVKSATDGQWFWRLKNTRGGRTLAHSESYTRRVNALRTVNPLAAALQCPVFVLRKPE
jgi:uncharacterized protein YegP (UPF0339 family)